MYNIVRQSGLSIIMVTTALLSTSCIKPVDKIAETPTPGEAIVQTVPSGNTPFPTPATNGGSIPLPAPSASRPLVTQFIQSRSDTPNNLVVWYDQLIGNDQLQGFSYTNLNGLPCAGFILATFQEGLWQLTNGGAICGGYPNINGQAGAVPVLTSNGAIYTIVFGRVEDPTITAVAVEYDDNTNQSTWAVAGGFLLTISEIVGVRSVIAVNERGDLVITNIPLSDVN